MGSNKHVAGAARIKTVLREAAETRLENTYRAFHPFPARMPLELASTLISSLTEPTAQVLDPMLGSGTTAIAARKLGRSCYGSDLDPMAVTLSQVATSYYSKTTFDRVRDRTFDRANHILSSESFRVSIDRLKMPDESKAFIDYWFPDESQHQLLALVRAIGEMECAAESRLAWTVFSSLIIAKTATASYATDTSRTRPRRNFDKNITLPFDAWLRRFKEAENRMPFVGKKPPAGAKCRISVADARALSIPDASVDFILTSPPYLNAIDYLRSHRMSLVWMGHDLANLRALRGTMCGSTRGMYEIDGLPTKLEERLSYEIEVPRKQAVFRRYLSDVRQVFSQVKRVLKPGGAAILVFGPNLLTSDIDDTAQTIRQLSRQAGLHYVEGVPREIGGGRSLPFPTSPNSDSPLAKRMRQELMIALRNPA
ncbi:MAG: DNA methyltransferase [Candidatus Thiodiazotropha endolucinida]